MAESQSRRDQQPSSEGIQFMDSSRNLIGDDLNNPPPVYNTWTQFSGMSTHTVTDNTTPQIHWDTFSPSSNPPFNPVYTNLDPNAEYLSQILTNIRINPTEIETVPQLADPGLPRNSSFHSASMEGQAIYAETLNSWSDMNSYDPFGTTDVLKASQEPVENANTRSKPSYSEIAKSLKSKPIQSKEKEEVESTMKKVTEPSSGKHYKSFSRRGSNLQRQHSKGHIKVSDDMESRVKPNSRYGLDKFDEVGKTEAGNLKSDSVESIPLLSRKGSTSSVSSGTSGIEEIHLSKGPTVGAKKDNSAQKTKQEGKQKTQEAKPDEKPFFDPRRIFQQNKSPKDASKSSMDSTILNNGKPMGRSKSTSENHRKSSDYINNDLRDAKKKTNQPSSNKEMEKKENSAVGGTKNDRKQRNTSAQTDLQMPRRKKGARHSQQQYSFDQEYIGKNS